MPDRTGFDQNGYAVEWRGDATSARSVAGICGASWGGNAAQSFDLSVRVTADRRRF
ncbi:hypothetical protein [Halolamina salifodinae]|uniref:Uncharacterized protein n=1 Tax=Halolamina salifodinae TaxID=1202767 RepID=A0A8T4GXV3_9EURY|nr:hypothetical protein [Halolamina salifodinae]MBP1987809.1 hypothetical protein [Halolamina salifodinae]